MDTYKKKYEKALSWIKDVYPTFEGAVKEDAEHFFPELKESENERIRKALIKAISRTHKGNKLFGTDVTREEALAWLEKQKDCIKLSDSAYTSNRDVIKFADKYSHTVWENLMDKFNKIENYSIGCNDVSDIVLNAIINTYNWLEKQGEQKANYTGDIEIPFGAKDSELQEVFYHIPEGFHAEIEGDKVTIKQGEKKSLTIDIKSMVDSYEQRLIKNGGVSNSPIVNMCVAAFKHGVENTLDELHLKQILANSAKTCKDEQKSTETVKLSAQEEYCICELEAMVKEAWRKAENVRNDVTIKKMQELMFFLKTLNPNKKPQRIISAEAKEALYDKPAWSEEDEVKINRIVACLENLNVADNDILLKDVDWLKTLKQRIEG